MPTGFGVQNVLRGDVDGSFPFSFAETPDGKLLLANGVDPMLYWDGMSLSAVTAGIVGPVAALQLGGLDLGYITGRLVAFVRFLDADGHPSNLSPVSNVMDAGIDGLISEVSYDASTGVVTVKSISHGLATDETILVDGIEGIVLANGRWQITVLDADTFTLNGLTITSGQYTQGGAWTLGVQTVAYGAVPIPMATESKVVRRQILRNLSGNLDTLYVDIDTADLTSTVFLSSTTDAQLSAKLAVPMFYGPNELPHANRHGVPPSHKSIVVPHKGRIFAAVDAVYSDGHCEPAFNSTLVRGVGTSWRSTFVGRLLYVTGATKAYRIADVDEIGQQITLATPYLEPPAPYALYSIRPDPGERRLIYYSEPGESQSWPVYNAIAIPEDNDVMGGLIAHGQYLYVIERRHIYRLTFEADPADGMAFLAAHRGSLSNRTYAETDSGIFMLDEIGIHCFDDSGDESISLPIQNVFQGDGTSDFQVDWTQDQTLWHAARDLVQDTIRWFVGMQGHPNLLHAICYHFRTKRFWIEEYPTPMTSSCDAVLSSRRSLAGTQARRIVCLSQGAYDGIDGSGTTRGTATTADAATLTDSAAIFNDLEGAPITIISGTGAGQTRIIAANTSTMITVVQPWDTTPDTSSVYQVGGIPWSWRSGWFRYLDEEEENSRDIDIVFRPLATVPGSMCVRLYFDNSLIPRDWNRDLTQDNVTTESGSPDITIDITASRGWARQRISGHGNAYSFADRFVSVELSGVQAGEPVRVSQVIIDGVE